MISFVVCECVHLCVRDRVYVIDCTVQQDAVAQCVVRSVAVCDIQPRLLAVGVEVVSVQHDGEAGGSVASGHGEGQQRQRQRL